MKTLDFNPPSRNLYHTLIQRNIVPDGGLIRGNAIITGFCPEDIEVGDILNINGTKYEVESVYRRDHKGIFKNPKDNINSFFEADTKFTKTIPVK